MTQERHFSQAYGKLVQGSDDIVGLFAYALYKEEKINYIKKYVEDNGSNPSDEDLDTFHYTSMQRLNNYRELAQFRMEQVQNSILEDNLEEFSEVIKEQEHCTRNRWWFGVSQSFMASFVWAAFIGVVIIILLGIRYGFNAILSELFKMVGGAPYPLLPPS